MSWLDLASTVISTGADIFLGNKAADEQADAAEQSRNDIQNYLETLREDQAPYRDVGSNSLYQLASGLGTEYEGAPGTIEDRYATALDRFQKSPGYQFQFDEGVNAIDASSSARGLLDSGRHAKELQRYGTGLASQEWGNHQNRLAALAGIGQTSVANTGSQGLNANVYAGRNNNLAGAANASGYTSTKNAINSGLQNLATIDFSKLYGG